jgi:pSer/pThr/pTyr-binding forkhead associated (FHA) protein
VSFCARCGASLIQDQDESQTTISFVPGEDPGEAAPPRDTLQEGASLVIRSGGGRAGETYALRADRISVGRHPDSTIFLDDVTVSRNHAVVEREGGAWYIADEGSLNGTYVNRRRVERQLLTDGDELQIGKYKLTFITQ